MALVAVSGSAPAEGLAPGQSRAPFGRMQRAGGGEFDLASLAGMNAYVLAFIDTRCPVSNDYNQRLADFARQNQPRGVAFVAMHADPHPSAGEAAHRAGLPFPVLMDAGGAQADHLGARVAPEVFVFDGDWTLRYRGRVDEDRLGSAVPSADLQAAVDAVLAGRSPRLAQTEAFGCPLRAGASP